MIETLIDRIARFVTRHNRITILVMLLLTGVMFAGVGMMETGEPGEDEIDFNSTEIGQALEYLQNNYGDETAEGETTATSAVYVRPDGNALAQEHVVTALTYQETVLENESVQESLTGQEVVGPPNVIGTAVAGSDASIAEQREAVEALESDEYEAVVAEAFSEPGLARIFLPASYEIGSTEAESMRIIFEFEEYSVDQQGMPVEDPTVEHALFEAAEDEDAIVTLDQFAAAEWFDQQFSDTIWLILPAALVLVLGALAVAYRDIADVLIGFLGVLVSVFWFFGIVGWLGIPADFSLIVGPVLIVALSIDFGLHVFMRYREQRGPEEGIREPMRRGTASVAVAFLLVAITAGIGFSSNVTSPLSVIQQFGVAITFGVFSACIIFVTLVPALKVSVDGLLERVGFDRRKSALGTRGLLKPVLSSGVDAARHGALVVIVVALLAGVAGGVAYTELDREGFQNELVDEDDWQTDLPQPLGWESHEHEYQEMLEYTNAQYQSETEGLQTTAFLIQGDVTTAETLERVAVAEERASEYDSTFSQGGIVAVQSPLTVMEDVAADDEEFAALYQEYNPREGNISDEDVVTLYDAVYEADAEAASEVIERTDGEYRTVLVDVPVETGFQTQEIDEDMHALADDIEGGSSLSVIPVGSATLTTAELGAIADGVFEAMLLALGGVLLTLALVFRSARGSATLGALTVVPIALVMALVFGGMFLLGIPLTFLTAFLVAITIGLGIDYNIHISDRFAQEVEGGKQPVDALYTTVRGTGGALFGSALTSSAAFSTIALHPHPQFHSLGLIVVLALVMSFIVSVLVLPSLLYLWSRQAGGATTVEPSPGVQPGDD